MIVGELQLSNCWNYLAVKQGDGGRKISEFFSLAVLVVRGRVSSVTSVL